MNRFNPGVRNILVLNLSGIEMPEGVTSALQFEGTNTIHGMLNVPEEHDPQTQAQMVLNMMIDTYGGEFTEIILIFPPVTESAFAVYFSLLLALQYSMPPQVVSMDWPDMKLIMVTDRVDPDQEMFATK